MKQPLNTTEYLHYVREAAFFLWENRCMWAADPYNDNPGRIPLSTDTDSDWYVAEEQIAKSYTATA